MLKIFFHERLFLGRGLLPILKAEETLVRLIILLIAVELLAFLRRVLVRLATQNIVAGRRVGVSEEGRILALFAATLLLVLPEVEAAEDVAALLLQALLARLPLLQDLLADDGKEVDALLKWQPFHLLSDAIIDELIDLLLRLHHLRSTE